MIRKVLILAALVGLLSTVSCSGDQVQVLFRQTGTISGIVLDVSTGQPVVGATIQMMSNPFITDTTDTGNVGVRTTTAADGSFSSSTVPIGVVDIYVTRDGYKTSDTKTWSLSPGGSADFAFELIPGEDPPEKFEDKDEHNAWPPNYVPPGSDG